MFEIKIEKNGEKKLNGGSKSDPCGTPEITNNPTNSLIKTLTIN